MERLNGDIDDEHFGIGGFTEGTNPVLMRWYWLAFNGGNWISRDGVICDLGDNLLMQVTSKLM